MPECPTRRRSLILPKGSGNDTPMKVITTSPLREWAAVIPSKIPKEVTPEDRDLFFDVINDTLTPEQKLMVTSAGTVVDGQTHLLAVHWHPEFIPLELISQRIKAMFPAVTEALIIPTQHNVLTAYGHYTGVEVDCFAARFNQKVQLLLHLHNSRLEKADKLRAMLAHTFKYRSSQLFELIHALVKPVPECIEPAVRQTGADDILVQFARIYVRKIATLLNETAETLSPHMIKNKMIRNYFDRLRPRYGDALIDRAQAFLRAVKLIVKANFPLTYFYRTAEVIEEARAIGAGIVVPHPEQFWPILLADYDVDGYEVWNPQSLQYTEFLIDVIHHKNCRAGASSRNLLIFMGDDTHMGEKVREPDLRDPMKANREIGYQPAWEEVTIQKGLIRAGMDRPRVITEYRQRLDG